MIPPRFMALFSLNTLQVPWAVRSCPRIFRMPPEVSLPQVIKSRTFAGGTVTYDYILRRAVDAQPVCVSARFQADIIIIAVYHTVFYQYIGRGIYIHSICARSASADIIVNGESVDTAIIGVENLTSPKPIRIRVKSFKVTSVLRSTKIPRTRLQS